MWGRASPGREPFVPLAPNSTKEPKPIPKPHLILWGFLLGLAAFRLFDSNQHESKPSVPGFWFTKVQE